MKRWIVILIGIFTVVLLLLAAAAVYFYFWLSPRVSEEEYQTDISVTEGSVVVYKLKFDGSREFMKIVSQGENLQVTGHIPKLAPVFEKIEPIFSDFTHLFLQQFSEKADALAKALDAAGNTEEALQPFTRLYTQEELETQIAKRMESSGQMDSLHMTLDEEGFKCSVRITKNDLGVTVTSGGIIEPDRTNGGLLRLKINWAKAGPIPMPPFMLRQLENAFNESQPRTAYPIQVVSMGYQEGAILITCRKAHPANFSESADSQAALLNN